MKYTCAECNIIIDGTLFRCADLNTCSYKCSHSIINRIEKTDPLLAQPYNWNFINNSVLLKDNILNKDCGLDITNICISSDVTTEDIYVCDMKIDKKKIINRLCGYIIIFISIIYCSNN